MYFLIKLVVRLFSAKSLHKLMLVLLTLLKKDDASTIDHDADTIERIMNKNTVNGHTISLTSSRYN